MHTSLTTALCAKIVLFCFCTKFQVENDFNCISYTLVLTVNVI